LDNFYRRLVSKFSTYVTWLFLPGTRKTSDPMTGFFAFRKKVLKKVSFSSYGFKILVELLAGFNKAKVVDIPFVFRKRKNEQSKASLSQGVRFFKDLLRLFVFTNAGDSFMKLLSLATLSALSFLLLSSIFIVFDYFTAFTLPIFVYSLIALIIILAVSVPIFFWVLKSSSYLKKYESYLSVLVFSLFVFWIFSVFNVEGLSLTAIFTNSLILGVSITAVFFAFKPIWLNNFKKILSIERWFLVSGLF